MRAFVISSGVRIAPFGEHARDLPIGGVTLGAWQRALFERFGLEVVPVERAEDVPSNEPRIVTYDHVLFTRRVLKSFLERWRAGGASRAVRVALPRRSKLLETCSALQDYAIDGDLALFELYALPAGAAMAGAAPLEVVYREKIIEYPTPVGLVGVPSLSHPITSSVCMHVRHWIHLLLANRLAIQIRWVDHVLRHPVWAASVLARALVFGRGRLVWRVAGRLNRIGRGVDIHPTARVEGSFIGDGVRIGAQALVRASIVGAGSILEERTNVSFSVLGERCFVSKNALVYASAAMEGANLGMTGMQMCVAGRGAALTPRATATDVNPGRRIKVRVGGALEEIDLPILGACFGHDTFVGADLYIAPGREIPNGVRLGPQPERVLSSIPAELEAGRMYVVRDGRVSES